MSVLSQAGRQLLKKLTTGVADYVTGNIVDQNDDINNVVANEINSGGVTGINQSNLVPATENQAKQSSFMNGLNGGLEAVTDTMRLLNPGTLLNYGANVLSNTSATINRQSAEQTTGQNQTIEYTAPTIGATNTGDNALGIHISDLELEKVEPEEEDKSTWKDVLPYISAPYAAYKTSKNILDSAVDYIRNDAVNDIETAGNFIGAAYYGGESRGEKFFYGDTADDYKLDLQGAVQYYNAVQDGYIPQSEYDAYLDEFIDKYNSPLENAISETGLSTKEDRIKMIKSDISDMIQANKYMNRVYELNPEMEAEENEKTKQINTALSQSMEKINNAVKYSNLGANAQEFVNDSYNVLQDQYSRMTNAIAPARRVKTNLIKAYGTEDTSQYSEKDKHTMEYIKKIELAYATFVSNYGDRVASYVKFASPVDGRIIIPDIVDGVGLHDAVFKDTDFLTNGDYGESMVFGKENASAIDVLATMSANVATEYEMGHGSIVKKPWTWLQRSLRPVGEIISEASQQSLGYLGVGGYNVASAIANIGNGGNFGQISFSALNQDNTLLSTLNTNNSQTGRLLQRYVAGFMEYTPEIVGNTVDTFYLAGLPGKLRNASKFRVLLNKGLWKPFQIAKQSGKGVIEVLDTLAKGEKIAVGTTEAGETISEGLNALNSTQRFWRYVASDLMPELVWDQMIDASLSSADTDFGSNTSMVFSLGGTTLGTLGMKLAEAGLRQMGKNGLNMIKESSQNGTIKTSWLDGTVWNVLNTLESENVDALVKATYNLNSSQLATREELKSFARDFKIVSDTVKAAYGTLTPEQQRVVTQAVKGKMGDQLRNLINQVYGGDSQFARRITQIIRDDRTNPADVFKYALGVNGNVEIGGWKSRISLADSPNRIAHGYNERLDLIPGISDKGFGVRLREGFNVDDLKKLAEADVSWAKNWPESGYFKEVNGKYYFTKKGLNAASDIRTSSLDIEILAKSSESAEEFDSLIRNSNLKKISDATLQDIKDSGAYDTLADALAELDWLCKLRV